MKLLAAVLTLLFAAPLFAQPEVDGAHRMTVTGVVPGPPLWQVKNGDNTLWIFGMLDPVPKNMQWDSNRVERVIAEADAILRNPSMDSVEDLGLTKMVTLYRYYRRMRTNMPGDTLQDVLPEDVWQDLLVAKDKYGPRGKGMFKLRPLLAARELSEAAEDSAGVTHPDYLYKQLRRYLRRSDAVRFEPEGVIETEVRDILLEIDSLPIYTEVDCLRGVLENIDAEVEAMGERAYAWANGYMGELYVMDIPRPRENCINSLLSGSAISQIREDMDQLWLNDAETILQQYRNGFAILPMTELLSTNSLLDKLQDRGYEVIMP